MFGNVDDGRGPREEGVRKRTLSLARVLARHEAHDAATDRDGCVRHRPHERRVPVESIAERCETRSGEKRHNERVLPQVRGNRGGHVVEVVRLKAEHDHVGFAGGGCEGVVGPEAFKRTRGADLLSGHLRGRRTRVEKNESVGADAGLADGTRDRAAHVAGADHGDGKVSKVRHCTHPSLSSAAPVRRHVPHEPLVV